MISIRLNEYAIKKHFFAVFVCLLLSATAWIFVQGDRVFSRLVGTPVFDERVKTYANEEFGFAVSYPEEYLVGEEATADVLAVYFTKERKSPFQLKSSPIVFVANGDRASYIEGIQSRKNTKILATRNVTAGNALFAKEVLSAVEGATGGYIKETVLSRSGIVYVIFQRYAKNIDPAYPLLIKTFQFK